MEFTELVNTQHHYHFVETWQKTLGTFLPDELSFLKCRLNLIIHQYLMSTLRAIKTTRPSSVRGVSRDETTIKNMLVNLANYLPFRPLDKLVRWRNSEDCTGIIWYRESLSFDTLLEPPFPDESTPLSFRRERGRNVAFTIQPFYHLLDYL